MRYLILAALLAGCGTAPLYLVQEGAVLAGKPMFVSASYHTRNAQLRQQCQTTKDVMVCADYISASNTCLQQLGPFATDEARDACRGV